MAPGFEPGAEGLGAPSLGLIIHLVVSAVMLGPLLDLFRFRLAGGRILLAWQPSWRVYWAALRRHGARPPLDAAVVVTAGYGALLAAGGAPAQVHALFALLLIAAVMPPLYWVSERGVLILRPHIPWRRELSPWHFWWSEVQSLQPGEEDVALRVGPLWPGTPAHLRIVATEDLRPLLHAVQRIRPALGKGALGEQGAEEEGEGPSAPFLDRHRPPS